MSDLINTSSNNNNIKYVANNPATLYMDCHDVKINNPT